MVCVVSGSLVTFVVGTLHTDCVTLPLPQARFTPWFAAMRAQRSALLGCEFTFGSANAYDAYAYSLHLTGL